MEQEALKKIDNLVAEILNRCQLQELTVEEIQLLPGALNRSIAGINTRLLLMWKIIQEILVILSLQ